MGAQTPEPRGYFLKIHKEVEMTFPQVRFTNARTLAVALKNFLLGQGYPPLMARPWNQYLPEQTMWWVIPGTEWPAYRYGKLFVTPDEAPEGCLFCGLHLEKGLGRQAAAVYQSDRGRRLLMDEHWLWHDFVTPQQTERFAEAVAALGLKFPAPVFFRCEAGPVLEVESFDPRGPRPRWDVLGFSASGGSWSFVSHERHEGLLEQAAQAQNPSQLMRALASLPRPDWVWVDIYAGVYLAMAAKEQAPGAWDTATLWERALSPWEPWFR
jgi:hypothetical protein